MTLEMIGLQIAGIGVLLIFIIIGLRDIEKAILKKDTDNDNSHT